MAVTGESMGMAKARIFSIVVVLAMTITALAPLASNGGAVSVSMAAPATRIGGPSFSVDSAETPASMASVEPVELNTIVLQPNATDGKESAIANGAYADNNYGGGQRFWVGKLAGGEEMRGYIQFTLPPAPRTLLHATLSVYILAQYGAYINCSAHALNSTWTEGTGPDLGTAAMALNWTSRMTATPWVTAGGDYHATPSAYMFTTPTDTWLNLDVTAIVANWQANTWINNGFLIKGNNLPVAGDNGIDMVTSDDATRPTMWPKLTLSYSACIDPVVPAQSLQEDEMARIIPLNGRGSGTVEHTSATGIPGDVLPFGGAFCNELHLQYLYTPTQVGSEGVISAISFNLTNINNVAALNSFSIRMAHTSLAALTTTFANNYNGYLIEVLPSQTMVTQTCNGDTWFKILLNGNFTYDSAHNLLIDITWQTDNNVNSGVRFHSIANTRMFSTTLASVTGGVDGSSVSIKFLVDVVDNAVVKTPATDCDQPFPRGLTTFHHQALYNKTYINQSGIIDKIYYRKSGTPQPNYLIIENLSIRLAHTTNTTLGTVFEAHRSGPWVEVFNVSSVNLTGQSLAAVLFDVANTFTYDGVRNLLVDIRYNGMKGPAPTTWFVANFTTGQASNMWSASLASATGSTQTWRVSLGVIFADSANLTWTAASSAPTIFTASVSGRNLVITPLLNQFGTGTVALTLHNSNGISVSQSIPVIINAVNDAPILTSLPNLVCVEDVPRMINISANISDVDVLTDPIANITVSTNSTYATVIGKNITFTYPQGKLGESVLITITDKGGLTDTQAITTTVTMVNDKPYFTSYVNTLVCDATVDKQYVLHTDDEETPNNLTISTSSPYATINNANSRVTFNYVKGVGSELVKLYLVDKSIYGSQNNVTYFLNVTIIDHPEVTDHTPTGVNVSVTTPVVVTFDMAMNQTKAQNAFSLKLGTTLVNGTFSWSADGKVMTFTPSTHMTSGLYNVEIAASAESAIGVKMFNAYRWNFTAALGSYDGDSDGMPDQYEEDNGLDPNANDAQGDADGDGMPNIYEYANDFNPQANDAELDADNDGYTNLEEYEEETDPNDVNDKPAKPFDLTWVFIVAIVVAVVLVLVIVMRKKKPAQTQQPGQQTAYQELRELRPEVQPDQPPQGQPAPAAPEQPQQGGQPPATPQDGQPPANPPAGQ